VISAQAAPSNGGERPVRVLWRSKRLGAGGAEPLLTHGIRHKSDDVDRAAPHLLVAGRALVSDLEPARIPMRCLCARCSRDSRSIVRRRALVVAGQFDVVHVHSAMAAVGARPAPVMVPAVGGAAPVTTEHGAWSSYAAPSRLADNVGGRRVLRMPGRGPILTCRAVATKDPPPLDRWQLALGDVEPL
jgi:hypothetical protein